MLFFSDGFHEKDENEYSFDLYPGVFQSLFHKEIIEGAGIENGIINFQVFRNNDGVTLAKSSVSYFYEVTEMDDVLAVYHRPQELDLIKEINVNNNLLSNIRVHCPENIYGGIYAQENDLDDVILLNPNKRIARTTSGNLLFLEGNVIKVPKQTEGAYISPLMENFVTFLHKNNLADIQEHEIIAFESQKAEEILMISDEKGIFSVGKIRNKTFENTRFLELVEGWKKKASINKIDKPGKQQSSKSPLPGFILNTSEIVSLFNIH